MGIISFFQYSLSFAIMKTTTSQFIFLVAVVHILLWTNASACNVQSHLVVAKDKNLKGTMVLSAADKTSLSNTKAELSKTLTNKVQSDSANKNSKVTVNEVRELSDGTLALDYECSGTSDQNVAKKTLSKVVKQDDDLKNVST